MIIVKRKVIKAHTFFLFPLELQGYGGELVLSGACCSVPWLSIGLAFPLDF